MSRKLMQASNNILDQVFYLGQAVQPDDMNNFYNSVADKLNCFFPISPAICSGLGYSQAGTSNVITFNVGYLRFVDQPNVLSDTAQATFAPCPGQLVTVTCPDGATQYIVAILTITEIGDSQLLFSSAISATSMTLAQIAAQTNPSLYLPLYTINNTGGVYTLGVDDNCAYNYAQIIQNIPYATELIAGIIQIATNTEAKLGINSTKSIVPSSLAYVLLDYATKDQVDTDLSLYAKLLSPLFRGNPRAPTAKFGDSSDTLANTQFVNGIFNIGAGYIVFPNGFAIQWGTTQIPANYDSLEVPLPLRYDAGFACANAITQTGANPVGTRFKDATYQSIILSNGAPNTATATWITLGYWSGAQVTGFDFKQLPSASYVGGNWAAIFYNKYFVGLNYSQNTFLDTTAWFYAQGFSGVAPDSMKIVFNPNDKSNQLVMFMNGGGGFGSGIYVSNENSQGGTWTPVRSGINGLGIDINNDKNPPTIMAGALRSVDNGNTWTPSTGVIETIYDIRYLGQYNGKYRWLSYQGGALVAYISEDDGASWNPVSLFNYGATNSNFKFVPVFKKYRDMQFSAPSSVRNLVWQGSVPLWSTIDNGNSWQLHTTPSNIKIIAGFESQTTGKYIYIALFFNGNLAFSYDLDNWTNTGISNMQTNNVGGGSVLEECGGYMLFAGNVQGQNSQIWATKDGENWYTTNLGSVGIVESLVYSEYSGTVLVGLESGRSWYSFTPELT